MASGKTHDWVTVALLPSVFIISRWGMQWPWLACSLLTLGTWLGGSLLSPDLDTRSRPFYRWGLFRFIWWPYQWMIRHRSGLSHGILLAAWFRVLYLSAVLILVYIGVYLYLAQAAGLPADIRLPRQAVLSFLDRHLNDILLLGAGVWLGSLLHILLDSLSSAFRRRRR